MERTKPVKPRKQKKVNQEIELFRKAKICVDGVVVLASAVSFHLHLDEVLYL